MGSWRRSALYVAIDRKCGLRSTPTALCTDGRRASISSVETPIEHPMSSICSSGRAPCVAAKSWMLEANVCRMRAAPSFGHTSLK
eukprot:3920684-Prymnesium_polylepis.1